MSSRTYTIKQIREMLDDMEENMNIYKYLDCAEGFKEVNELLQTIEDNEVNDLQYDYEDIDVMSELNG